MPGTAFESFWEGIQGRFPSQTSADFMKPLLKETFNAARKLGRSEDKYGAKRADSGLSKISGGDIVASGRTGASTANE